MADEVEVLARVGCFFAVVWGCGRLFSLIHAQLVGEILAGILLSQDVIGWLPPMDLIVILGQVGLIFLVLEGGMSINVHLLPRIGLRAVLVAVTGTLLPVLLGWAFMTITGKGRIESIAAGAALSSTSIGMASKMLQSMGQLNTTLGNLIAVAAMIDDVLSLVILAVLQRLGSDNGGDAGSDNGVDTPSNVTSTIAASTTSTTSIAGVSTSNGDSAWVYLEPVVVSCAFVLIGAILVQAVPRIERAVPWRQEEHRKQGLLLAVLLITLGLVTAAGYTGTSYLLGAFTAGMAFADVPGVLDYWLELSPVSDMLSSIFFASIGLIVPVNTLFKPIPLGYGVLYTIPAILGKLVTGVFAGALPKAQVVGWAMVGRGELGFLMAQEALEEDLVGSDTFIASVWALLLCTLLSPLAMRRALDKLERTADAYTVEDEVSQHGEFDDSFEAGRGGAVVVVESTAGNIKRRHTRRDGGVHHDGVRDDSTNGNDTGDGDGGGGVVLDSGEKALLSSTDVSGIGATDLSEPGAQCEVKRWRRRDSGDDQSGGGGDVHGRQHQQHIYHVGSSNDSSVAPQAPAAQPHGRTNSDDQDTRQESDGGDGEDGTGVGGGGDNSGSEEAMRVLLQQADAAFAVQTGSGQQQQQRLRRREIDFPTHATLAGRQVRI
ncbi:hypothetical protein PTSG_03697 [Salpingoeca rosetta]|uniref:Cation/H+ exchanger transmembrane domain-containing protein n=1 Tax=Salpingoeca rosetta (strain ATCC 50818 / BSB-021) TaxID=946362 RepID=F2U6B9_SALR5|nr:uncharacterized protein PTSG_03697 [Salpingoeca rosetta]EGD83060.1 hypothetical protein PTSG_03697 [Salpingoeca rosetta]|eukprot:XP_004995424.1 hypothetical protein PTSG_03697 [Salpingoeca rosetta]